MCAERLSENIVICIDTSRSMFRTDYAPNRLHACTNALKKLINDRISEDEASSFAIINFSDKAEKIIDFTNFTSQLEEALDSSN